MLDERDVDALAGIDEVVVGRLALAYVYSVLRLISLAPDIVTAIVIGRSPPQLTAKKLMSLSPHLPIDWAEQRQLLGFR